CLELLRRGGVRIEAVHLADQRPELREGEVGRAAQRRCRPRARARHGIELRRCERSRALLGEVGEQDVGGRVQVALVVAADELSVARERDVALEDAGTHASARLVALLRVLGKLQRSAATMADRERRPPERSVTALLEGALQPAGTQFADEIEGT